MLKVSRILSSSVYLNISKKTLDELKHICTTISEQQHGVKSILDGPCNTGSVFKGQQLLDRAFQRLGLSVQDLIQAHEDLSGRLHEVDSSDFQ